MVFLIYIYGIFVITHVKGAISMTIHEMQDRKRELGLSNQQLSELTGIPVPTLQKIFSGSTKSPRRSTIQALEQAFSRTSVMTGGTPAATYPQGAPSALSVVAEAPAAYAAVPVRPEQVGHRRRR